MEKGSVAICFVQHAVRRARQQRLDVDLLLQRAGIAPQLLALPHARVPAASYSALWRVLTQAQDDEFFGQDARRMKPGSFALVCRSALTCKTLGPALQRAAHIFGLLLDDLVVSVETGADVALLRLQPRAGVEVRVFAHETMLMLLHGLACWLIGRRIPVQSASFAYLEPPYSDEYRSMYSTRLCFEQAFTTLRFDAAYLARPVVQTEAGAREFLLGTPANVILKYKNGNSLAARIRRRLRTLPACQWPEFDVLAAELRVSGATLRRRLQQDGQSYQAIRDQLRRDLAVDALLHSSRSVAQIALELGFAEPSAFYRAFKKWTHVRPAEYRRLRLPPSA